MNSPRVRALLRNLMRDHERSQIAAADLAAALTRLRRQAEAEGRSRLVAVLDRVIAEVLRA